VLPASAIGFCGCLICWLCAHGYGLLGFGRAA
jgi:hypothetical protein